MVPVFEFKFLKLTYHSSFMFFFFYGTVAQWAYLDASPPYLSVQDTTTNQNF